MKRQEFLDELRSHLKVLEDEEQQDIIDEYFQHIEMKMESGLDEEAVIKDFGPVWQLAAQILEAYHVKPEYEKEVRRKRFFQRCYPKLQWAENGKKLVQRLVRQAGKLVREISAPFKKAGQWWKRNFRKKEHTFMGIAMTENLDGDAASGNKQVSRARPKDFIHCVGRGFFRMTKGVISFFFYCCRLAWNLLVLMIAAASALLGLIFLFLLGALTVLLIQGYPLAGIVIGCLGAVLCFASLAVCGCTFFWKKA